MNLLTAGDHVKEAVKDTSPIRAPRRAAIDPARGEETYPTEDRSRIGHQRPT